MAIAKDHETVGPIPLIVLLCFVGGAIVSSEGCCLICLEYGISFFSYDIKRSLLIWAIVQSIGFGFAYLALCHDFSEHPLSNTIYTLCVMTGALTPFALHLLYAALR